MAPLHVAVLTVQRELPKINVRLYSILYPTSVPKNETMAPHEVATLTVIREHELIFSI